MEQKSTTTKSVIQNETPLLPTAATLTTEPSSSPGRNRRAHQGSGVIGQVSIQHRSSKERSLLLHNQNDGPSTATLTSKFKANGSNKQATSTSAHVKQSLARTQASKESGLDSYMNVYPVGGGERSQVVYTQNRRVLSTSMTNVQSSSTQGRDGGAKAGYVREHPQPEAHESLVNVLAEQSKAYTVEQKFAGGAQLHHVRINYNKGQVHLHLQQQRKRTSSQTATTAGGGKKGSVLKLDKIALASRGCSRATSYLNIKEAYDSKSLFHTTNDFFGPPGKQKYQMLDQTYHVPLKATKAPPPPSLPASKHTAYGEPGRSQTKISNNINKIVSLQPIGMKIYWSTSMKTVPKLEPRICDMSQPYQNQLNAAPAPGRGGAAERPVTQIAGSSGTRQQFRLDALVANEIHEGWQAIPRIEMFSGDTKNKETANSSERKSDYICDSRSSQQVPSLFQFKPRQHIFESNKGQELKVKSISASNAMSVQSEKQEQRNQQIGLKNLIKIPNPMGTKELENRSCMTQESKIKQKILHHKFHADQTVFQDTSFLMRGSQDTAAQTESAAGIYDISKELAQQSLLDQRWAKRFFTKRVVIQDLKETRGKSQENTSTLQTCTNTGPSVSLMQPIDKFGTLNSHIANSMGKMAFTSQQTLKAMPSKVAHTSHHDLGAVDLRSVKKFRKEYRSKMEQQLQDSCILINEHNTEPPQWHLGARDTEVNIKYNQWTTSQMSNDQNQFKSELSQIPIRAKAKPKSTIQKNIDKKQALFHNTYQKKLVELRKMDFLAKEQTLMPHSQKEEPSAVGPKRINKAKIAIQQKQQRSAFLMPAKPIYEKVFIDHAFDFSMKIISSRLQLLSRLEKVNKQLAQMEKADPIRAKLRVMYIDRAPRTSADFFFVQAGMYSINNDQNKAMKFLHQGQLLSSNKLLYRFNHGVIMFKLGLLHQAKLDFETVSLEHPQEFTAHFNYSLCLFQLGQYENAKTVIEGLIKMILDAQSSSKGIDHNLLRDAHMLKAQCYWRTNQPIEAVKSFGQASRYIPVTKHNRRQQPVMNAKALKKQLIDFHYKEMKYDIKVGYDTYVALRSRSAGTIYSEHMQQTQKLAPPLRRMTTLNDLGNKFQSKQFTQLTTKPDAPSKLAEAHGNHGFNYNHDFLVELNERKRKLKVLSATIDSQAKDTSTDSEAPATSSLARPPHLASKTKHHKADADSQAKPVNRLSIKTQLLLGNLKANLRQRVQNELEVKELILNKHADMFYQELREEQIKVVDTGFEGQRFDIMYSDILKPATASMKDVLASSLKNMVAKMQEKQCTAEERRVLELRRKINEEYEASKVTDRKEQQRLEVEHWPEVVSQEGADDDSTGAAGEQDRGESDSDLPIEYPKRQTTDVAELENGMLEREVEGAHFASNSLHTINQDQIGMVATMQELQEKFVEISRDWEREIEQDRKRIFKQTLKDQYVIEQQQLKHQKELDKQQLDVEDSAPERSGIIEKLHGTLVGDSSLPDDVCNILQTDVDEQQKVRASETDQERKQGRLNRSRLGMIQEEFEKGQNQRSKQSQQILASMLGHLTFFKRFEIQQQKSIIKNAKYVSLPARTIIFNQGDIGDVMYIILKGRVVVEKKSREYGNLPLVVAILKDGYHFGELSLIDQDKVGIDPSDPDWRYEKEAEMLKQKEKGQYATRKASCITAEQTDLLMLDHQYSQKLLQPDEPKNQANSTENSENNQQQHEDELSQNIKFLQGIPILSKLDAKVLIPIACNIIPQTFKFGETLVKQGEIPQGFMIIVQGQCKVVTSRPDGQRDPSLADAKRPRWSNSKNPTIQDKVLKDLEQDKELLNQIDNLRDPEEAEGQLSSQHEQMVFSQLTRGDSFGARTLIPYDIYSQIRTRYFGEKALNKYYPFSISEEERMAIQAEPDAIYHTKSLLSVVADSAHVEAWILDKSDMAYLPDKILKDMYDQIATARDYDRPYHDQDLEFVINQFQRWSQYKIDYSEGLYRSNGKKKTQHE